MQKLFGSAIIYFIMLTLLSPWPGYCAEQDPAQFITEFYTWYISEPNRIDATKGKEICRYVAQETLEEIKIIPDRPGRDRTDYFLKLSSGPSDMNGVSIVVPPVEALGPDTLVTIVTIVSIDKSIHNFPDSTIVVVLKNIKCEPKIVKCIDSYAEA